MVMRRCVKYRRDIHNLMGVGDDVFVWVSWAPENHMIHYLVYLRTGYLHSTTSLQSDQSSGYLRVRVRRR